METRSLFRRRRWLFGCVLSMGAGAGFACGPVAAVDGPSSPLADGGAEDGSQRPPPGDAGPDASDGATDAGGLGFAGPVEAVPESPCVELGGDKVTFTEASTASAGFDRVAPLGGRHLVFSREFGVAGTVTGGVPSAFFESVLAAGVQGSTATFLYAGETLYLQSYAETLTPVGTATAVAPMPASNAAVVLGATTLVTYVQDGEVRGKVFPGGGAPVAFSAGAGSAGRGALTSAAATGDGFVVVWTRRNGDGTTETLRITVGTSGTASAPLSLLRGDPHTVVDVVATDDGAAVLFQEGVPAHGASLLFLDGAGKPRGALVRLQGTSQAFDLTRRGADLAVVAAVAPGRAAVRLLSATGAPRTDWRCVDDLTGDLVGTPLAGVEADAEGYVLVARRANGASWLRFASATLEGRAAP